MRTAIMRLSCHQTMCLSPTHSSRQLARCLPLHRARMHGKWWTKAKAGAPSRCLATSEFAAANGRIDEQPIPRTDKLPQAPHVPVLMQEVLQTFTDRPVRTFFDGTLGAAGHASALLHAHPELERYLATDFDPDAHAAAGEALLKRGSISLTVEGNPAVAFVDGDSQETRGEPKISTGRCVRLLHGSFLDGAQAIASSGVSLDGALLDLGLSSMQLETPSRGFAFGKDGPLDMRMDPRTPVAAADIVNGWTEKDLGYLIRDYGEDPHWRSIARRIVEHRVREGPVTSTAELADLLSSWLGRGGIRKSGRHPATRTFQALRIAVNRELHCLEEALPLLIAALAPRGKLAVISFHSLEDRIVKRAFRAAAGKPLLALDDSDGNGRNPRWLLQAKRGQESEATARILTKRPIVPTQEEVTMNPRARSAKLRVLEKL